MKHIVQMEVEFGTTPNNGVFRVASPYGDTQLVDIMNELLLSKMWTNKAVSLSAKYSKSMMYVCVCV